MRALRPTPLPQTQHRKYKISKARHQRARKEVNRMQTTIQTRNAPCGHCQIVLTLDDIARTKELRGQLIGAIKAARRKQYCRTGQRIAYRLETKIPSADETDGTESENQNRLKSTS